MSHEMPFKKLIWKFSLVSCWLASCENFAGISLVSLTRETVTKLSVQSWKTWELDLLTRYWTYTWNKSRKHLENMIFTPKQFEKHGWYKLLSKANKKNKNLFRLIHIWLSTHTSHLNMYNHTNEIDIHWTLNLCVVCVCIKCEIVLSLEWSFND